MTDDLSIEKIFRMQEHFSKIFSLSVNLSHLIFLYGYHSGYLYSMFEYGILSPNDYEILQRYLTTKYAEAEVEYRED